MNYSRSNYIRKIAYEVELAKKYDVTIVSAAEADWVDEAGVGFYDQGIEALLKSLEDIQNTYPYEKLGLSFHHYNPIKDLMVRINQGIENKYELEVSPYVNNKSVKVDSAIITDEEGNEYKPITGYHSKNSENVINFYGLEYGKEYTITIKSGNAVTTKTFTYGKGTLGKLEIAYDKIELTESDDEDPESPKDPGENPDDDKKEEEQPGDKDDDDDNKNEPGDDDDKKDNDNKDDDNKDKEEDNDKKDDEENKDDDNKEDNPGEQPENPDLGEDNNDKPNTDDKEETPNTPEESEQNPYPNQNGNIFENEDSPNTYDRIVVDTIISIASLVFIVVNIAILFIKKKM